MCSVSNIAFSWWSNDDSSKKECLNAKILKVSQLDGKRIIQVCKQAMENNPDDPVYIYIW